MQRENGTLHAEKYYLANTNQSIHERDRLSLLYMAKRCHFLSMKPHVNVLDRLSLSKVFRGGNALCLVLSVLITSCVGHGVGARRRSTSSVTALIPTHSLGRCILATYSAIAKLYYPLGCWYGTHASCWI